MGMGVGRDFCNVKVKYIWKKNIFWKKKFYCYIKIRIVNVLNFENEDV